jgi:hypothetical protein
MVEERKDETAKGLRAVKVETWEGAANFAQCLSFHSAIPLKSASQFSEGK